MERDRWLRAALAACQAAGEIQRGYYGSRTLNVETKGDGSPVTVADRESEAAIRRALRRATPEMGFLGEEHGVEGSECRRWIIDPLDGTKSFVAGVPFFAVLLGLEVEGELEVGVIHAPALGPGGWPCGDPGSVAGAGCTWYATRGQGAFFTTGTELQGAEPRRLRVSQTRELARAFVSHGGLRHFQERGLWPAFSDLVRSVYRTRGFGDWWGHVLVAEGVCDAMVDAVVAYHDVAAVKVLVEEAGGTMATQGESPLAAGYQGGVVSSNGALARDLERALGF